MPHAPVRYVVRAANPAAHLFSVELTVESPDPAGQLLRLPAWIPGSYMIREFAKNIIRISASDARGPVALTKLDKDSWQAAPASGPLVVVYEVYAWDLSVRTAHLDQTHGFFNGTSLFLAAVGQESGPHDVTVEPPADRTCADWEVATTLPRLDGAPWGFGRFQGADYDALLDHPFELGTFTRFTFTACGVPHHVAITGRHRTDAARLSVDLTRICEAQSTLFGDRPPFDQYLFLVMAVGEGYGGLEHRDSTALICRRDDLPLQGVGEVTEGYRDFLGLCSHEYFHAWNVKRIKPRAFVPYDLRREGHTTLLWAFEGLTSYFDDVGVLRAGCIDLDGYLELLGRTATAVWRTSGRRKQSLADSSFDAWTKYYRQDENSPNAIASYYQKGALVGLALDLTMRRASGDKVGLDDLMRGLWARYGDGSGVPEDGVEALANDLAGADLTGFFDAVIRGTQDPDLANLVGDLGLKMFTRPSNGDLDRGGRAGGASKGLATPGDLGVTVVRGGDGARLKHVHDGGAAQAAGLSADDVILAIDGLKVGGNDLTARVQSYPVGAAITVHAFRRDELSTFLVKLQPRAESTVWFEVDALASAEAIARRDRWIRGRA